jgi:hypothetical protein
MFRRDMGVASPGRRTKAHPQRCVEDEDAASGVICSLKRQRICVGGALSDRSDHCHVRAFGFRKDQHHQKIT